MQINRIGKRLLVAINWSLSLVMTKEVLFLALIIAFLVTLGVIPSCWRYFGSGQRCASWVDCIVTIAGFFADSFSDLFNVEAVRGSVLKMLIFFVAWLVGGGALVSIMVGQFNRNVAGDFRRWRHLIGNHIVVLGWDDGVLMELVGMLQDCQAECFIVTKNRVADVERLLRSAGIGDGRIQIYRGDYDDEQEWKFNLKIDQAVKILIAGESDEDAHDARVLILFDKVQKYLASKDKHIETKVNIHDFGLAYRLSSNAPTVYENFHMRWANALWGTLKLANDLPSFDLYIVGFGAMGKAVALEAINRNLPFNKIYVTDDDAKKLGEERVRFFAQFAKFNEKIEKMIEKIEYRETWDKVLEGIKTLNEKNVVFVVAKRRSEKGLLCMMDIIAQLRCTNADNIRLALDQEVDGYSVDSDIDMKIGSASVQLFGMKRGCDRMEDANKFRNHYSSILRQYASEQGDALVASCGVPNARYILGGALGYDAALVGNYDIDLRLLIPDAGKPLEEVRRQIDAVKNLLAERAKDDPTFTTKFIDEGGTNYIWHTKQIVKVPGIPGNPDVELTWNIQAESTYRSISEMAARLPRDVIDRYVIAKWNAQQAGKEAYKALKEEWKSMINLLIDRGGRNMDDGQLCNLLESLRMTFPSFLTGSVS